MSRALGLIVGLLLLAGSLSAQRIFTFERLVVTDGPVSVAAATISPGSGPGVTTCTARLEEAQIRYRWDGTGAVGATTGMILEIGDLLVIETAQDAAALRFAKTGSTTGVLMVTCWRP